MTDPVARDDLRPACGILAGFAGGAVAYVVLAALGYLVGWL